jgi:hypothetical protein
MVLVEVVAVRALLVKQVVPIPQNMAAMVVQVLQVIMVLLLLQLVTLEAVAAVLIAQHLPLRLTVVPMGAVKVDLILLADLQEAVAFRTQEAVVAALTEIRI